MTSSAYKIVVWERSSKLGKWCPYSPEVCQFLEDRRNDSGTVSLGDVNEELKVYFVNLKELMQVSEKTGTKLPVRRRLCDSVCVFGRGFSWQWLDDHDVWNTYETDVNDFIDSSFLEGKKSVNLNKKFPGYSYEIVFPKMIQINKHSKRKRKIRRQEISSPYPIVNCEDDEQANDTNNTETDDIKVIQEVLTPEYLAQEVPGTAALLSQVNNYKRNVECCKRDTTFLDVTEEETAHDASSKHQKVLEAEEQDKSSNLGQSSSTYSTTYAIVDGRPWYDSRPPHTPQSRIKPVPGLDPLPKVERPKKSKRKGAVGKNLTNGTASVLEQYTEIVEPSPEMNEETCIICCESLSTGSSYDGDNTVSKLTLCSHMFHKSCLEAMYNSGNKEFLQCPSCKQIHGEKCGAQPPGEMIYHVLPYSLPGYPEYDTIRIIYDIHSGIQGPEHPNPGKRYTARGFPRHCYLPDNEMGRKILRLLVKAWKRRLIFTIGQSSTTGEENTVTWNEIHHKTEFGCNRRGHGYPDENYFSNILAELEAHGIKDEEVRVWYPA